MKILLDIDGVMVTTPSWQPLMLLDDNFSDFNKRAVCCLNNILLATSATIVLTTSHKANFTIEAWLDIFHKRGIPLKDIERLPENVSYLNRRDEIMNWLELNNPNSFVIIDDDKSLNDLPEHYKNRLILTHSLVGLTDLDTPNAIKILKR